jgi:hypothetical protein
VDKTWDKLSAATQVQLQFVFWLAKSHELMNVVLWQILSKC